MQMETDLAPEILMRKLLDIEAGMGRQRDSDARGYQPRIVDLDLIDCDGIRRSAPELTLPHPRAHLRRFVLVPLQEIDAGFSFSGSVHSLTELLERAPSNALVRAGALFP